VLGFGYFDGDNRCDAVKKSGAGLAISSGGKGPWKALPGAYDGPFDQMRFFDYDKDGVTDIFRRASDGGWQVAAANGQNSRRLNSSGFPITALLFANLAPDPGNSRDHRKDAVVDILRAVNGQIHVSRDGVDTWKPLNLSYGSCDRLFIADINADGQDDIVRFAPSAACNQPYGKWEASWSGATQWTALKTFDPPPGGARVNAALLLRPFAGHFDENPGADLLMIDPSRNGSLYSDASKNFNKYSIYPY
jgi:hypothetical protein